MTMHHFLPMILQPTRITPSTASLIDNIFTNFIKFVIESAMAVAEIFDHLPKTIWMDFKPNTYRRCKNRTDSQ